MSWVKRQRNLTTGAVFCVEGTAKLEERGATEERGVDMTERTGAQSWCLDERMASGRRVGKPVGVEMEK